MFLGWATVKMYLNSMHFKCLISTRPVHQSGVQNMAGQSKQNMFEMCSSSKEQEIFPKESQETVMHYPKI